MIKNYYNSDESEEWPLKSIASFREIENVYDFRGISVEVELECGDKCILTGDAIYNKTSIPCKKCFDRNNIPF